MQAMRKLYPVSAGPVEDIPGTGPAPMLMRAADWIRVGGRAGGQARRLSAGHPGSSLLPPGSAERVWRWHGLALAWSAPI